MGTSDETLLSAFSDYCRAAGIRPLTIRLRLAYLRRVPNLGAADRAGLLAWMGKHDWAPETRNSARGALVAFYRWMVDEELRTDNPAAKLPRAKVPPAVPRPTPDAVVDLALLAATDRERLMIALAAWAGLRRAEIASLRWAEYVAGALHVTGKGGRFRIIPVAPKLAELLDDEHRRRLAGGHGTGWRFELDPLSPYVFPGRGRRGPTSPYTVGDTLKRCLGDDVWSGHTLRHRFATMAYQGGGHDLLTVQRLMGHSSSSTTARYAAPAAASMLAAVLAASA